MPQKGFRTYENGLLLILGLSFGFAFFDRNADSYLSTYLAAPISQGGLDLNNKQLGMLGSILALSWAFSGLVIGRWSDAVRRRKPFLIAVLIIFSACSVLSGLSDSFSTLLASRLIMGIAEGPMMPICLAILTVESSPSRRGLNIGIVQSVFSSLLGAAIAPVILVKLAIWFNWRIAFFLSGIPGLLCAVAVVLWVREPQAAPVVRTEAAGGLNRSGWSLMFEKRNIWLCSVIACLMVSWLMLHQRFLMRFFTEVRHFSPEQGSWIMSATGYCAMIAGFLGAAVSDRIGRKPVVFCFCLMSLLTPLAALYFQGSIITLAALMFIGWVGTGAMPLFMAVIPGETLPQRYAATAMGLVVCIGEVIGGSGSQYLGGWAADLTTLAAPIKIAAICALGGTILSLFLKETAPVKTGAAAIKASQTAAA